MRQSLGFRRAPRLIAISASLSVIAAVVCGTTRASAPGDSVHGKELYAQCAGCHQLQANHVGPRHCALIGRRAGELADYDYSSAMKESGLTWDAKTLDEFLSSPITYVSGTKMGFAGIDSEQDRADLIAYLVQAGNDAEQCPKN